MSQAESGQKPDTLWYTRCSIPTPLGVGAQLGLYEDEFAADGIVVRSLQESNDPAQQASHFEHTLPHSFRLGGSIPPIWARAKGQDTKVIGISWIDEYQAIIALPESGIRSPKDLRGRRLGLPQREENSNSVDVARASALRGLLSALELAGLDYRDAEWIDVPTQRHTLLGDIAAPDTRVRRRRAHSYTDVAHALIKGDVDAIYVKDVRGAETAHLLAAHVVVDLGFHPEPWVHINNATPRPLTINTATLEQHPQLVERFMRRVVEVDTWARRHPDETVTQIARETNWTEAWVRFAYGDKVHEHLAVNLDEKSIHALNDFKDFLLKWNFIAADFSLQDWIDPRPLTAVLGRQLKAA